MTARLDKLKSRMVLPAIAAPMFLVSGPDMVTAASKAGIMGSFPGPNTRTLDDLRQWFRAISSTIGEDDGPWAFNMITHSSYGQFDGEIALVEEFQPDLVITALGGPHRVTEQVHSYGGLVFADVTTPRLARKALDKGAEALQSAGKIDFSGDMHDSSKAWKHVWSAGHGVGTINGPETLSEAVATLVAEYERAVAEQATGSRYLAASRTSGERR